MAIKEELMSFVDPGCVLVDPEVVDAYSRDNSFIPPGKPTLVVKPKNVSEVQQIVRWANRTKTALVPVSSGPPHFRGDTVPGRDGAVIVDLSTMKKVIRIDRRNRIAIIEPGVTYGEIQLELAKKGLRLSMPLCPRRFKSVVASLLEREPTLIPKYQWTLMEPLRCLEVVWGDGSRMWTGEAGEYSSQDLDEQQKMHRSVVVGMGPGAVDYYRLISGAQGTMGIVTWVSIKCDILPQLTRLFFIPADEIDTLLDCAYKILRIRFGDEILILNSANLASMLGEGSSEIEALKEKLPKWVLIVGISGRDFLPQERVEYQEKDLREICGRFGLKMVPEIPGARDFELDRLLDISKEPFWKLANKGGNQDIFFLTTLDKAPGFVNTMKKVAQTLRYDISDVGVYIQPLQQGVACHCEFSLPYDPEDTQEVNKIQLVLDRASKELVHEGAYFSRPYGIWANMMYDRDKQTTALLRKVKEMFDPNHILNPGKLCF